MLCPYSLTTPGGVQGQVMGLARELRRMGHEVRVLGPCDGAPPDTFVTPLGDSLPTAANGSVAPLAPDPSASLRTIRVLKDEEFDILHLHEPLSPGPTFTSLVMQMAPIVATFHAAGESASYKYLNAPLKAFAAAIEHRVAVSKDAVLLAERYLGGDYEILPNGVEIERFAPVPNEPRATRRAIFFCGRHEPRKGLEYLLKAHATLSDDVEKASRLRQAAVFCAPSLGGESFGVVLIEAMAANTPIVASSLDGYMNVATNMIDAILVEPADVAALEAGLRLVLDDPELAASLVEHGARRAAEFSMRNLAVRYEEIYRRVLENHSEPEAPSRDGRIRGWWSIAKRLRALASNSIRRMLVK